MLRRGIVWLAPVALVPLAVLGWLRAAPEQRARVRRAAAAARARARLGVGAAPAARLRGRPRRAARRRAPRWIAVHSVAIWLVASTLPILAAIWAVGLDLGGPVRTLAAGWMTLAALGAAVALPSAPGFFGLYHSACRLALEQFGASAESALAIGTLVPRRLLGHAHRASARSCCARATRICATCELGAGRTGERDGPSAQRAPPFGADSDSEPEIAGRLDARWNAPAR